MKTIVLVSFFLLWSLSCAYGFVITGGNWLNPDDWEDGLLPGPNDDVIVDADVPVNVGYSCYCHNLTVTYGSILQNISTQTGNLDINGSLYNYGDIRNNLDGYTLRLYVNSDIVHGGVISCEYLYLDGTADQHISNYSQMFAGHLVDQNSASGIILDTDLYLAGVAADLNNATLIMHQPGQPGRTLTISSGSLQEAVIQGGNGATLDMGGEAYLYDVDMDEINFAGVVQIGSYVTVGTLNNHSTLINQPGQLGPLRSIRD